MDLTIDGIIKLGALIGALAALWKIVTSVLSTVRHASESVEELKKTIETLVAHDREQHLAILRLTIMNAEMPISERVIAGQKYIKDGGNGDVAAYYREYLEHLHEQKEDE